jgi:hypothetical protein
MAEVPTTMEAAQLGFDRGTDREKWYSEVRGLDSLVIPRDWLVQEVHIPDRKK